MSLKITNHSTLYHLAPYGQSTGNIENLTSYISRLATAHCLPVQSLIEDIVQPVLEQTTGGHHGEFYRVYAKSVNGIGLYARVYTTALEKLTLQTNLRELSMLPLSKFVDNAGKGMLKINKEWCPVCYSDQIKKYGEIYDLLKWCLVSIERCQIHSIKLQDKCPCCGRKQWPLPRYTPLGQCAFCGAWLYKLSNYEKLSKINLHDTCWINWVERNMDNFLESRNKRLSDYSHKEFSIAITMLINDHFQGKAVRADQKLGFADGTITQWRRGRHKPRLDDLMSFAYRLGVNLDDVLHYSKNKKCDVSIMDNLNNEIIKLPGRVRIKHDHARVEAELERIVVTNKQTSIDEIAKRMNVSKGYLKYRFHKKIKLITINNERVRKKSVEKRLNKKTEAIRGAVTCLHQQGIYPGKRNVAELSGNKFSNLRFTQVWRESLLKLGYKLG